MAGLGVNSHSIQLLGWMLEEGGPDADAKVAEVVPATRTRCRCLILLKASTVKTHLAVYEL